MILDPDGIIRHYEYDEWHRKQASLDAEPLNQEEREVTQYADVGWQIEGNKELGEEELKEKSKVGEDELREKRWTGYEIMTELKRMEEEGEEKRDQMGAEYADERREIREAMKDIEKEYEDGEEKQGFVKIVDVWEEEMIYNEENIREEYVDEKLDFAEDRTKYSPNDDHSHNNTEPQDYDEMVFEIEVSVHFHDYTDERLVHPGPGIKSSSQIFEVVEEEERNEREEGKKREAGRYVEVRDKAGEEKVEGMWGCREIGLQGNTEIVHVDVKETWRMEEGVQEMEKVGEGKMTERREMGETKKGGEMEKFEYEEREEKVESNLEALEVELEEARYVDINAGEVHLNEKQLITETIMEPVLSGGYIRDAIGTYLISQYMPRDPTGNDQLGSSANEGVEYPGQAVKPFNQKNGKVDEVNTDVEQRDVAKAGEVGRKIEVNQKAGKGKMKENLVPIDVEAQKPTGIGHMEVKKGKRMEEERMQDRQKTGKEKGLWEVGKERKHFEVQEKCVDTNVEKDVGENMEVTQANTTCMEEKAGDKSKRKCKLPDDWMKHRLEDDHTQYTKERPQGSYNIKLKLEGNIHIYHYTGRHAKYADHDAKYEESS
jgi:hypothetical protein